MRRVLHVWHGPGMISRRWSKAYPILSYPIAALSRGGKASSVHWGWGPWAVFFRGSFSLFGSIVIGAIGGGFLGRVTYSRIEVQDVDKDPADSVRVDDELFWSDKGLHHQNYM